MQGRPFSQTLEGIDDLRLGATTKAHGPQQDANGAVHGDSKGLRGQTRGGVVRQKNETRRADRQMQRLALARTQSEGSGQGRQGWRLRGLGPEPPQVAAAEFERSRSVVGDLAPNGVGNEN